MFTMATAYLVGVIVTATAFFIIGARISEARGAMPQRLGLSLAAGTVWPVMLVGLFELSSIAAYAKVHEPRVDEATTVPVGDGERVDVLV